MFARAVVPVLKDAPFPFCNETTKDLIRDAEPFRIDPLVKGWSDKNMTVKYIDWTIATVIKQSSWPFSIQHQRTVPSGDDLKTRQLCHRGLRGNYRAPDTPIRRSNSELLELAKCELRKMTVNREGITTDTLNVLEVDEDDI